MPRVRQGRAADVRQVHVHLPVFHRAQLHARGCVRPAVRRHGAGRNSLPVCGRRIPASAQWPAQWPNPAHRTAARWRYVRPSASLARCPRGSCATAPACAPAGDPPESIPRVPVRAAVHGWARTAPWHRPAVARSRSSRPAPLVIVAVADHELDLVATAQDLQLVEQIARHFTGCRGLHVHHSCTRVDRPPPPAWRHWFPATRDNRHRTVA